MVISYFPYSMRIYYLEFFCRKELFLLLHLFICSIIYLYHYGLMDIFLLFG